MRHVRRIFRSLNLDRIVRYWLNSSIAVVVLLVLGPATTAPGSSQVTGNHDPDAARFVTSDIPNFWRAFDRASLTGAADLFQRDYLDAGSIGLRDFTRARIQTGRALAASVAARPRYYAAIRENTTALDTTPSIKHLLCVPWRRTSGGGKSYILGTRQRGPD
jgi:hypothetical protein